MPPFHGDEDHTFHTSNFREAYRATEAPKFQHDLLHQVALPSHTFAPSYTSFAFNMTLTAHQAQRVITLVGKRLHSELSDADFGKVIEPNP